MKLRPSKFVIFFALVTSLLFSCKKEDAADYRYTTIWQGFHHVWEYNHRVNRMGDWIDDINLGVDYNANAYHSAASGIGPDKNEYTTFLTRVKTSKEIHFSNLKKEIIIQGMEGTVEAQSFQLSVEIPATSITDAVVLLNGFDIYARPVGSEQLLGDGDADKLFNLSINTSSISINPSGNTTTINFELNTTLGADCASVECSSGSENDFFDYLLTMHLQIIAGENGSLKVTSESLAQNYSWERPRNNGSNEIFQEDFVIDNINITGSVGYTVGFPGIQGFNFQAEKGLGGFNGQSFEYPHMQTFNLAARPIKYTPTSGLLQMEADIFFKNWAAPVPFFSYGAGGAVNFEMNLALVQILDEGSSLESYQLIDEIIWLTNPLEPAPPNIEASLNVLGIGF
jgi:hypothetical protein